MKPSLLASTVFICLLSFLPSWALLTFFPMSLLQWDYVVTKYSQNVALQKNKVPLDILFLGGSGALTSVYPKSFKNALNMGVALGRPLQSYYLLREFLKNNPPPKVLFITVPFNLKDGPFVHRAQVKYGLYNWQDIFEVFQESSKSKDLSFQGRLLFYYKNFSLYFKVPFYYQTEILSFLRNKKTPNSAPFYAPHLKHHIFNQLKKDKGFLDVKPVYDSMHKEKKEALLKQLPEHYEAQTKLYFDEPITPVQKAYLEKIKKMAEKYHIRLFVFMTPVSIKYDRTFYANSLKKLLPNHSILVLPNPEKRYFLDPVHLTKEGALLMSEKIRQFLAEQGVWFE